MKHCIILPALLLLCSPLSAQRPPDVSASCRQAMTKLSYLAGDWKGQATLLTANGDQLVNQEEHIEWKLQKLILAIEGIGHSTGGEISFQALALVNFEPGDQQFKLKTFVKEGYSTNAYFTVLSDNNFEWGFDVTGGKTRYLIALNETAKTWHETGEFSRDGATWLKFIELNLIKQ